MSEIITQNREIWSSFLSVVRNSGAAREYRANGNYDLNMPDRKLLISNPNWKTDIAQRRDASRAYRNAGLNERIPMRVTFEYTTKTAAPPSSEVGRFRGISSWSPSELQPYDDTLRDIALSRIKRKLASQTKEMQGVVPLVEIRELRSLTNYLVNQTTNFAAGLFSILKNPRNSRSYRKLGKTVADFKIWEAWLAYSFAIKPTLSDIDNAVAAIKNYLAEPPRSIVLKGTASKEWFSSRSFWSGFGGVNPNVGLFNTVQCQHSLKYIYTAGFDINLLSSNTYNPPGEMYNLQGFLNQFGLTFEKLPGSVWELIPFSWMTDYFGTIGAFLDDAFESPSGSTRYCTESRKYGVKLDLSAVVTPGSAQTTITSASVVGGFYEYYDFQRTVLQKLPHRSLRFKTADEIGVNGVNRLLNLLSVLAGFRKSAPLVSSPYLL